MTGQKKKDTNFQPNFSIYLKCITTSAGLQTKYTPMTNLTTPLNLISELNSSWWWFDPNLPAHI